ncbi:hypothetical protein CPB83DRAFT_852198 [Crepidotus variabilis]|uniref:Pali-domain-containing protein n=1 Tax=Crepidotus variabilis TaxID=179855 RepID=A0A9P6EJ13_9AGAR|nr:hypothetical protein CPB83DRAFT_852198 [Crepidotus variabilis]
MKAVAKPFARYPITAFVSCGFLFATFILLLLVGISLTIIKPIYLVTFRSTTTSGSTLSIATELRFGVWGVCATSGLNPATLLGNPGLCFGPQLGYDVPEYLTNIVGISQDVVKAVEKALLVVLVLHPIAAGISLLAFMTSAFLGSHAFAIFSLILTIITALLTSVVLAIDLALVIVAQNQVKNLQNFHFAVQFGNGVWMILTAVVLVWGAVITLSARACYCMGVRRHPSDFKHKNRHVSDEDLAQRY